MTDATTAAVRERVLAAARACIAAQGLRRTTVDDIAAAAGISRATLYRAFPGGRDTILAALLEGERADLLASIGVALAEAGGLREELALGLCAAARWLTDNALLQRLMFEEPATVLTHVEFEQMDRTLEVATDAVGPLLERHLEPEAARRAGEWVTRIVLSFLLFPTDGVDLCDPASVEVLVDRHVLPGVLALAEDVRH